MPAESTPPIPLSLTGRPTSAGLVVPAVTPRSGQRWLFGLLDADQQHRCLHERLCQVCGRALGSPMVLLLRESDLAARCTSEPALHPECAAYTRRACPMIAGRMSHYRTTAPALPPGYASTGEADRPTIHEQVRALLAALEVLAPDASDPDDGAGPPPRVTTGQARAGAPAEPWHAVWLQAYDVEIDPRNGQPSASYRRHRPLRIRPVRRPEPR